MIRFWEKVAVAAPDECWKWTAFVNPNGYGKFKLDGRTLLAHRVAYELEVGPIPAGLQIDHLCRVRDCVNPAHLEPVTPRENTLRGDTLAAKMAAVTHCPQGHPYEGDNLYLDGGRRRCRTCRTAAGRRHRARMKSGAVKARPSRRKSKGNTSCP